MIGKLKKLTAFAFLAFSFVFSSLLQAQDADIEQWRDNLDIFSGVLEKALGLDEGTGLFGMNVSEIDPLYLQGQGVVVSIRTPLAARRLRVGLDTLGASIQGLQLRGNPFEFIGRSSANASSAETMALSMRQDSIGDFYRNLQDQIRTYDFSDSINSAMRQTSQAARSLRSMGEMNETQMGVVQEQLDGIESGLDAVLNQLSELQSGIEQRSQQGLALTDDEKDSFQTMFEDLKQQIDPIRESAQDQSEEITSRFEQARFSYAQNWRNDVSSFEGKLYQALCDYGASVRDLPAEQTLTIILTDLGDETEDGRRTDKVHIFTANDLRECQSGAIDVGQLQQRSASYDY